MTHKKPIKISPSSISNQTPRRTKYKPPRYHNVKRLYVFKKNIKVINAKVCNKNDSFNNCFLTKNVKGYF